MYRDVNSSNTLPLNSTTPDKLGSTESSSDTLKFVATTSTGRTITTTITGRGLAWEGDYGKRKNDHKYHTRTISFPKWSSKSHKFAIKWPTNFHFGYHECVPIAQHSILFLPRFLQLHFHFPGTSLFTESVEFGGTLTLHLPSSYEDGDLLTLFQFSQSVGQFDEIIVDSTTTECQTSVSPIYSATQFQVQVSKLCSGISLASSLEILPLFILCKNDFLFVCLEGILSKVNTETRSNNTVNDASYSLRKLNY